MSTTPGDGIDRSLDDPAELHRLVLAMLTDPITMYGDADSAIGDRLNPLRRLFGLPTHGTYGLPEHVKEAAGAGELPKVVSTTWHEEAAKAAAVSPFADAMAQFVGRELNEKLRQDIRVVLDELMPPPLYVPIDDEELADNTTKPHTAGDEIVRLRAELVELRDAVAGGPAMGQALGSVRMRHRAIRIVQELKDELTSARVALSAVSYAHHHRDAADIGDTSTEQLIEMANAAVGVFEQDQGERREWLTWSAEVLPGMVSAQHQDAWLRARLAALIGDVGVAATSGALEADELERWRLLGRAYGEPPIVGSPMLDDDALRSTLRDRLARTEQTGWERELDQWRDLAVQLFKSVNMPTTGGHALLRDRLRSRFAAMAAGPAELNLWRDGIRAAMAPWLGSIEDRQRGSLSVVLEALAQLIASEDASVRDLMQLQDAVMGGALPGAKHRQMVGRERMQERSLRAIADRAADVAELREHIAELVQLTDSGSLLARNALLYLRPFVVDGARLREAAWATVERIDAVGDDMIVARLEAGAESGRLLGALIGEAVQVLGPDRRPDTAVAVSTKADA